MKTTEMVLVVEGGEAEAVEAVRHLAKHTQVVQARVGGVPLAFEDLPNPPGSRFGGGGRGAGRRGGRGKGAEETAGE